MKMNNEKVKVVIGGMCVGINVFNGSMINEELISLIEEREKEENDNKRDEFNNKIVKLCKEIGVYDNRECNVKDIVDDLYVDWVYKGRKFNILENEGYEEVIYLEDYDWMVV